MSHQIHTCGELQKQIQHDPLLWTREIISQCPSFVFIRIQQLVAIATLGLLLWLCFGVSRYNAAQQSYPYYDTQKPLSPWSEPAPLAGNYGREGE